MVNRAVNFKQKVNKCIICGKPYTKELYSGTKVCSSKCFREDFWNKTLDNTAIIVNGVCYHDGGPSKSPAEFRGHAGAMFVIQRLDRNEIIVTDNLWCNGEIPPERNIKDNAIFL